jgi:hypothetical protein
MCLIKGAFVGQKNLDVIKMHSTKIKNKKKIKKQDCLFHRKFVEFKSDPRLAVPSGKCCGASYLSRQDRGYAAALSYGQ